MIESKTGLLKLPVFYSLWTWLIKMLDLFANALCTKESPDQKIYNASQLLRWRNTVLMPSNHIIIKDCHPLSLHLRPSPTPP